MSLCVKTQTRYYYVKGYCHIWFITRLFQIFSGTFYWAGEAEKRNSCMGTLEPLSPCTLRKKTPHQHATFSAKAILHGHVTQDESEKRAALMKQHRVLM